MAFTNMTQTAMYVPERIVTNNDLAKIMETSDEWIMERTGISKRHVALEENTSDLCVKVTEQLLAKANLTAQDLDFIIVATVTPDYHMPSTACLVQSKVEASNAFCFDITAACSGFVYALATADKFIQSGLYQRGIVIGAETMTKTLDWSDRSTAVLFGDGAGGVLLEAGEEQQIIAEKLQSDGKRGLSLTSGYIGNSQPYLEKEKLSAIYVEMDGRSIFDFALRDVSKNISQILAENNTEVDYVLAHQANTRILDAIAKKTKIPKEKFLRNMVDYANTSAASIPILLAESVEKGIIQLGSKQKIVLTGFGGGLTWGSILLELN